MSKRIYYLYNPDTDNYERVFPSFRSRMLTAAKYIGFGVLMSLVLFISLYYLLASPTERSLRRENANLKAQYDVLGKRLETSLKVMNSIQNRDDNFYRVMMQMDPLSRGQRFAGLDNEKRYQQLGELKDNELLLYVTRQIDLLDRQLYTQSLSFDKLREMASRKQDRIAHIPAILPLSPGDFTLASGYGYRLDPILGNTRFHTGIDFAAPEGSEIIATGDGKVEFAGWKAGYGNCIEINHGYNYMTRFGNLSKINVKAGQNVKRGDNIGEVGSSGKSSGPHLHYEVRFKDEPQDPVNYYFMGVTPEAYEQMVKQAENAAHIMD